MIITYHKKRVCVCVSNRARDDRKMWTGIGKLQTPKSESTPFLYAGPLSLMEACIWRMETWLKYCKQAFYFCPLILNPSLNTNSSASYHLPLFRHRGRDHPSLPSGALLFLLFHFLSPTSFASFHFIFVCNSMHAMSDSRVLALTLIFREC